MCACMLVHGCVKCTSIFIQLMHVCVCVHTCACMHAYVCVCVHACMCTIIVRFPTIYNGAIVCTIYSTLLHYGYNIMP